MNLSADQLPQEIMGHRLRIARENTGFTQAVAAECIGVSRTTLVAIERGNRPVRGAELQSLVDLYGVTMNKLLRRDAVHVDLVPRFRKLAELDDPGVDEAAQLLTDLVTAEVELETVLGIERATALPPERALLPGDVRKQAENDALELRAWLGIGVRPIADMRALLELELGVRVYAYPLKGKVSGLFAYDETVGACMLVNALHPSERQAQSLAHETGHLLSTRRRPEVYQENHHHNSREERYATTFGRVFLLPARAVMQKFKEITAGAKKLTRRHVIILAHYFGVSREAVVRRLEELGLAPDGAWEWFLQNGRITNEQVAAVLGTLPSRPAAYGGDAPRLSLRLETLAAGAMNRGLMSEGQIAQLLKIDRRDVRSLLYQTEDAGDDFYQLPE